jgi:hypothetical protein
MERSIEARIGEIAVEKMESIIHVASKIGYSNEDWCRHVFNVVRDYKIEVARLKQEAAAHRLPGNSDDV